MWTADGGDADESAGSVRNGGMLFMLCHFSAVLLDCLRARRVCRCWTTRGGASKGSRTLGKTRWGGARSGRPGHMCASDSSGAGSEYSAAGRGVCAGRRWTATAGCAGEANGTGENSA